MTQAIVLEIYYHHHIRNVWWGALVKKTTKILWSVLSGSLEDVDACLQVSPNMSNVFRTLTSVSAYL